MNYGETLAYWYLRLNGFFPLRNFVLHGSLAERGNASDCDILAVRHPWVSEDVGGTPDADRFAGWGLPLDGDEPPLALIVQVKTGGQHDHGPAFDAQHVQAAVRRTGLWRPHVTAQVTAALAGAPHALVANARVGKLLIASMPCAHPAVHLAMPLAEVVAFIRGRYVAFDQKLRHRMHFPDELIQFLFSREDTGD